MIRVVEWREAVTLRKTHLPWCLHNPLVFPIKEKNVSLWLCVDGSGLQS